MRWCIFFDTKPTSILLILKNCVKVEIRRCIYTYYIAIAIANDEKANFFVLFLFGNLFACSLFCSDPKTKKNYSHAIGKSGSWLCCTSS